MTAARRRRSAACRIGAVALLALVAAGAPVGPRRPAAAATCTYRDAGAERWQPALVPPAWATLRQYGYVSAFDRDSCALLATSGPALWRSSDAGRTWSRRAEQYFFSVLTEGLALRSGSVRLAAPVVATAEYLGAGNPAVWVSWDDGDSFEVAQVAAPTGVTPLRGTATSVAADVVSEAIDPVASIYVVVRQPDAESALGVPGTTSLLLRSNGARATFEAAPGTSGRPATPLSPPATPLSPGVVAVNHNARGEVWINDVGRQGGAWVSTDGGDTFTLATAALPGVRVRDITITPVEGGYSQVLLATDHGLLRSFDGRNWTTLSTVPSFGVRTAPDDAGTILSVTADGVVRSGATTESFAPVPGLPTNCKPERLRRTGSYPPVFLVDCTAEHATYRVTLTRYAGHVPPPEVAPPEKPILPDDVFADPRTRQLRALATWPLPDSEEWSGAIAFDGTHLLYDLSKGRGSFGMVRARDGVVSPTRVQLDTAKDWPAGAGVSGIALDLRRNALLATVNYQDGYNAWALDLVSHDLRTGRTTRLGKMPYHVPSYDSGLDELTWIPESNRDYQPDGGRPRLYRTTSYATVRDVVEPQASCQLTEVGPAQGNGLPSSGHGGVNSGVVNLVSTFVSTGDGGGYIVMEDDKTVHRVDSRCRVKGTYRMRQFSESRSENDALACDTQTFFPQAAIWVRDSQPRTVTAYAVPFGYCPMPSLLSLSVPSRLRQGATGEICAKLRNQTSDVPGSGRPVVFSIEGGAVLGRAGTDEHGSACLRYTAATGADPRRIDTVVARFLGDSGLFPASALGRVTVVGDPIAPPVVPHQLPAVVPPPAVPPPAVPPPPVIPAQPAVGPVTGVAPAPAPAPNVAQAPMGQAQPVAHGVVVPQRQEEPQLVFARAANTLQREAVQHDAMSALPSSRRDRTPRPATGAAFVLGAAVTCGLAYRRTYVRAPVRAQPRKSPRG